MPWASQFFLLFTTRPALTWFVVQSRIHYLIGDECLMDGVALEGLSVAGNLQLDNLVVIYQNNHVTCDGPLDLIDMEDSNAKLHASSFHVREIADGNHMHDVDAVVSVSRYSKALRGKPISSISVPTLILLAKVAGTFKAPHDAFDPESVSLSERLAEQNLSVTHHVPKSSLTYFQEREALGEQLQEQCSGIVQRYQLAQIWPSHSGKKQQAWLGVARCS